MNLLLSAALAAVMMMLPSISMSIDTGVGISTRAAHAQGRFTNPGYCNGQMWRDVSRCRANGGQQTVRTDGRKKKRGQ